MILIIGHSDLGLALANQLSDTIVVGRPEYNLLVKEDCDRLVADYNPTVVINTAGVNQTHSQWDILTVNYVSVAYLTIKFYDKMQDGQIVNISSTSTYWPSYPGIASGRLAYNISKEAISNFGRHFNRKIVEETKPVVVTTVELGKFNSKFNNYAGGMTTDRAAELVVGCITNPVTHLAVIK
jgi:short-subunit dehydrogenase